VEPGRCVKQERLIKSMMTKLWNKVKWVIWLVILLVMSSIMSPSLAWQDYPWQTALKNQLEQIDRSYGGLPQNVVVVHLGITDRDEQAYRIAGFLSKALNCPVIALPSYSGEPGDDLRKAVVQYYNSRTYPVRFEEAWKAIIAKGHRIVGVVFHSGAGIRANTERRNLIDFIRENPGKVTGNMVFAMTDLKGKTRKELSQVGINAVQIGADDFVSWATKPAQRFIPFGEYLGPISSTLGWAVKPIGLIRTIQPAGTFLSKHPLTRRCDDLIKALRTSSSIPSEHPQQTGGIDFSSLELRYLSEYEEEPLYVMGTALRAVIAKPGQGVDPDSLSRLSWNSLCIWLALPNSAFWVNLNPDEPDRIIDSELGKTDVGRILLEADFQMKKDLARFTHPENSLLGRQFWDKIYEHVMDGAFAPDNKWISIPVTFRVWIVPGKVVVCSTEEKIYVVNAELDVKLESEYFEHIARGSSFNSSADAKDISDSQRYAEGILKEMILPEIIKEVNTGVQYQQLRQIFYSRVIAEWYKTKHRSGIQAFGKVVGQGDIDPWRSSSDWNPLEIFESYKQSLIKGEYSLKQESETVNGQFIIKTVREYFLGGVDFIEVPMTNISYEQLMAREPEVREQIFNALVTPTGHCSDGEAWLGGIFVAGVPECGDSIE